MKFRTEIKFTDAPECLNPERPVLLMGSCFSDNIGAKIMEAGWPAFVNPCGVVYNPVSIAILFQLALTHRTVRRNIIADSITAREGKFVSWFMGSKAQGDTPDSCVDSVMDCIDVLEEGIETSECIILTFGTSDVWLLKDTDKAVGNCHKHPSAEFTKRRVMIEEITSTWNQIFAAVRMRNPEVRFILTVSPRRYLSDGFAENSRQKAVLILACEALCSSNTSNTGNPIYFPAYEIINDDLRDYRFYEADLLHPSSMAVDYIWEKFQDYFLDQPGRERIRAGEREARKHRHIKR